MLETSCSLPENLRHIAIIMDGNGRWAEERNLERKEGHKEGASTLGKILQECIAIRLPILTVYAFSKENWKRPKPEVQALFSLLISFVQTKIEELGNNNIKLIFLGDTSNLPFSVRKAIQIATSATKNATGLQLNIAFNYSAREEILMACRTLIQKNINPKTLTIEDFSNELYTQYQPDPDLLIRTGNEYRISNFLLFQCAYSELYFSPLLWPDFSKEALQEAIRNFSTRNRRFGA